MSSDPGEVKPLAIRKRLGRATWQTPVRVGTESWIFDHKFEAGRIAVTVGEIPTFDDGVTYLHASIAFRDRLPSFVERAAVFDAVFGEHRWAYEALPPTDVKLGVHPFSLHLWARLDGRPMMPEFGTAVTP